jgi:hypothetical protein
MKSQNAVFKLCPALQGFLDISGPRTVHNFKWLVANGFGGVFRKYLRRAGGAELAVFFGEFSRVDTETLLRHRELAAAGEEAHYKPSQLRPVPVESAQAIARSKNIDAEAGKNAFSNGAVAAVAFAGGAATRFKEGLAGVIGALPRVPERLKNGLDASAPKGCFPIGTVEGLNFFEMFAAQALETGMRCGRLPPCLLMTSGVTDEGTRRWLESADLWGMPPESIVVFSQAENPRLDADGDVLTAPDGRIVWTGNGHGGIYAAIKGRRPDGGSLYDDLADSGTGHLIMFNIDNAAARPFDTARVGRHVRKGASFTATTVLKTDWAEKIGVACIDAAGNRVEVIEYNSLPPSVAKKRSDRGLEFSAGHINVNIVDMMFLRSDIEPTVYTGKSVAVGGRKYLSSSMEFLNQHLTRKLDPESVGFYETARGDFFMPTKNPTGVDSVVTTFEAINAMYGRWLARAGACVAARGAKPGAFIEIHPSVAMDEGDLERAGIGRGWVLEDGSALYLSGRLSRGHGHAFSGRDATFREGSTFIVRVKRPYGNVRFDPATRKIGADVAGCGKFFIGNGTTVNPGVRVEIDVEGNGECTISDGKVFESDFRLVVKPGEVVSL